MTDVIPLARPDRFDTPVLLIVFNRPEETRRVFERIREIAPRRLYVAADGPRGHVLDDRAKCAAVREIVGAVDWECDVKRLLREENLGCGRAVSGAIDWFLRDAEAGIILEDDTLPARCFFPWCEAMLARCAGDDRVASISGDCFLPGRMQQALSRDGDGVEQVGAYASKYFNMWGWATWLDRWEGYSLRLEERDDAQWDEIIERTHPKSLEASTWRAIRIALRAGILDTWDFQFAFHAWAHGRSHAVPTANLVTNLGFHAEATHTIDESPVANLPAFEFAEARLPGALEADEELDSLTFFLRHLEGLRLTLWLKEAFLIETRDLSERIPFEKQLVELQQACNERMTLINKMAEKIRELQGQATLTWQVKHLGKRLLGRA